MNDEKMSEARLAELERITTKPSIHSSQLPPPKPTPFDLYKGLQEACREIRRSWKGNERLKGLYAELLYEVQNKIPGETRHETARRIIRQHENRESVATGGQNQ